MPTSSQTAERVTTQCDKHERDLYRGEGPGRQAGVISRINSVEERLDDMEKTLTANNKQFWAIILLLLSLMGGVAWDITKGSLERQPPMVVR